MIKTPAKPAKRWALAPTSKLSKRKFVLRKRNKLSGMRMPPGKSRVINYRKRPAQLIRLKENNMQPEILKRDIFFNRLRKKEYARLDKSGHVYLDYTAGNIHPQSVVDKHYKYLQEAVYGNPHSNNPASQLSEKKASEARERVLTFFNAPDYHCIFTANATAALQIVGECYPFSSESHFLLTADNHNSVNGIREYCRNKGAAYAYSSMNEESLSINEAELTRHLQAHADKKNKLFAFPAQSNASGVQHSLAWIKKAQELGWDVLLDAAAFVPTSKLDLSEVSPEFVSISFYKMFGYPTGIGCLLVKKSIFNKLKKNWFAGGTVSLSSVNYSSHFLKPDHEKFENGTINYLNIPAITFGLDFITAIGIDNINSRIKDISSLLLYNLTVLGHDNGVPLIKLYAPTYTENRGGTFLMNFLDVDGQSYSVGYIEQLANAEMISLRTGCFCNPGIDELNHSISAEQLKQYFTSRNQGDYDDMVNFLGKIRGAVRVSIGLSTTAADIGKFIRFVKTLVNKRVPKEVLSTWHNSNTDAFKLNSFNEKPIMAG
jgi:molybdenum cofactor sulfurtransferase